MSLTDLYIRDKQTGKIRRIGDNQHDQLTISRQATIDAIDTVDWYHPGSNGKMFLGASDRGEAWFRANDIYDVIEGMPFAELVHTCDGCIHSGKIDKDYPCRVCIRREKDYYAPER